MFGESFWVAVATILFIAAIFRPVARFVGGALDDRAEKIADELNEAMRLREEAQGLLVSIQRKQKDAAAEAEAIVADARHAAESLTAEAQSKMEAALNKRIELAMAKISQAEATALRDVQENITDIAVGAARELIKQHLTKEYAETLVTHSLDDINRKLH